MSSSVWSPWRMRMRVEAQGASSFWRSMIVNSRSWTKSRHRWTGEVAPAPTTLEWTKFELNHVTWLRERVTWRSRVCKGEVRRLVGAGPGRLQLRELTWAHHMSK